MRSHSTQPEAGVSVSVERVISLDMQATFEFQVTEDSVNDEQACAEMVVEVVPVTPVRYNPRSIEVGVMAEGQGIELKSNSR